MGAGFYAPTVIDLLNTSILPQCRMGEGVCEGVPYPLRGFAGCGTLSFLSGNQDSTVELKVCLGGLCRRMGDLSLM